MMQSKRPSSIVLIVLLATALCEQSAQSRMSVDADFPGGNIVVDSVAGDTVLLHQDLHDTEGNWFYWAFRANNAAGGKVTFTFTHPWEALPSLNVIGVAGPAVSLDSGRSWSWLGTEAVDGRSFHYEFPTTATEVRFSFGMPYTEANFTQFLKKYNGNPHLEVATLTGTREGRKVERLHLGNIHGKPGHRVMITARHHACEMMASYVLEGIIEDVLGESDRGKWFRENVELLVIPFVDKDGVENGEQGKNRRGRDHNRDYDGDSIYAATRALRAYAPAWADGKLVVALDLHCPYIRGRNNEHIYIVGSEPSPMVAEEKAFSDMLERHAAGDSSLPYAASNNLPYGQAWNSAKNFTAGRSFKNWAQSINGVRLAATMEIPYANASGTTVTQESCRLFGHTLSKAIYDYVKAVPEHEGQ